MSEKYDPNVHHRRSVRLAGYDYSQEGWYFVTICTQDRRYMFGEITGDRVQLNDAGLMIESWWSKLTGKFPMVQTDGYIVMPNHFHGIINVGAAPCGCPDISALCPDLLRFSLDKIEGIWSNDIVMRQMNRKNTGNWWWPAG